ncbi:pancreatic progenitor cell differentiation and proliferation factor isoform X2 [Heterocephalus glaber]|uniref:Pancreatic progenitor cell differentiation and proliferation factor isoform X2 n=1 Tax=Heterocephalus glaber TaxID=10181 RepID=A0AAX6SMP5_HETGA|nr:pancreatic progenitor cell differentiation and proliferation factor isoform X2 [Heterocephalus glaber]
MAAIPSSGSLVATHDYYRRRLGSASGSSSCGSAEYPGEAVPHHLARKPPRLPAAWSPVAWLRKPQGSSRSASPARPTPGPRPDLNVRPAKAS